MELEQCRHRGVIEEDGRFSCNLCGSVECRLSKEVCKSCPYIDKTEQELRAVLEQNLKQKKGEVVKRTRIITPGGPGTQLKVILAGLGRYPDNCDCNSYAAMMDMWGVEICRGRKAEIVQHLNDEWAKLGRLQQILSAAKAAWAGYTSVESIVDEAIRRAEEKERAGK